MISAAVLLCIVASSFGGSLPPRPNPDGRIVGGEATDISSHPYQLSLQSSGSHTCGAVIISSSWALTAAHCVSGFSASHYSLRAGTSTRGSGGTVHQASTIIIHSNYDSWTRDCDIALIKVSTAFSLSSNVAIIPLPPQDQSVSAGTAAVVTGWGLTSEGGTYSTILQQVVVPTVTNNQCNRAYGGGITDNMICAGYTAGGKDSCQGDSGGPLVANTRLIGIVSFGSGCARPNIPGVYTRVASFRNWISSNSGV